MKEKDLFTLHVFMKDKKEFKKIKTKLKLTNAELFSKLLKAFKEAK